VDGVVEDPLDGVGSNGAPAPGHRIAASHRFDLRRERFEAENAETAKLWPKAARAVPSRPTR
jgi:hypothetical protein